MNESVSYETPWLDSRGFPLYDEELKAISKSWDADTWERYLIWYEMPLKESQVHPREYIDIAERQSESIFAQAQGTSESLTQNLICLAIDDLPPRQREVINLAYWNGRSERAIAFELRISRTAVKKLKAKGLKRISVSLRGGLPTFPLMRGEIHPLQQPTGGTDDKNVLELAQGTISKAG
jgi:RNA polymerase sigma factor (sigma-70 family)